MLIAMLAVVQVATIVGLIHGLDECDDEIRKLETQVYFLTKYMKDLDSKIKHLEESNDQKVN